MLPDTNMPGCATPPRPQGELGRARLLTALNEHGAKPYHGAVLYTSVVHAASLECEHRERQAAGDAFQFQPAHLVVQSLRSSDEDSFR